MDIDPTARTAKRRPLMKLPARTRGQVLRKVQRLMAEAEREFARMPRRKMKQRQGLTLGLGLDLGLDLDLDLDLGFELTQDIDLRVGLKLRLEIRQNLRNRRGKNLHPETAKSISALARRIQLHSDRLAGNENGPMNLALNSDLPDPLAIPGVELLVPAEQVLLSLILGTEARARFTYFHQNMAVHFPVLTPAAAFQDYTVSMSACPLLVLACIYVTTICNHGFSTHQENRALHTRLGPYLDRQLARTIFVDAASLTHHLVLACMILSLWVVPPSRVHQYKSQIELITAYSVSVCIDAGTVPTEMASAVLDDASTERNNLRCFLAVYCSCGSLNFSLPRFNFATWLPRHDIAVEMLSRPAPGPVPLPSQSDTFLCFYLRVIHVGKDLSDLLTETGVSMNLLTAEEERGGLAGLRPFDPRTRLIKSLEAELEVYEARLTQTIAESGVLDPVSLSRIPRGEKYCLLLTYYQLITMIHDNLVSCCIYILTTDSHMSSPDLEPGLVASHVIQFGTACERILDCFVELNADGVTGYPTFFYYRAMAALISLIRLLVLVNSDILQAHFPEIHCVKFRLVALYEKVLGIVENSKVNYDLKVCERFSDLLERIGRWVHVVQNNEHSRPTTLTAEVDYLKLTHLSKGQEVEKFAAPQNLAHAPITSSVRTEHTNAKTSASIPDSPSHIPNFSIQEMFKGIDEDIIRYLNPFESLDPGFSFTFD